MTSLKLETVEIRESQGTLVAVVGGQGGGLALGGAEHHSGAGGTVAGGQGAGQTLHTVAGASGGAEDTNSSNVHGQDLPGRDRLLGQEVSALGWRGNYPHFAG